MICYRYTEIKFMTYTLCVKLRLRNAKDFNSTIYLRLDCLVRFMAFTLSDEFLDNLLTDYHRKRNTERAECLINDVGQAVSDSVLKYAECLE